MFSKNTRMNNIDGIHFRIVTELEEAKQVWLKLVIIENIYDNWDFRYLFYKALSFPLQFITAFKDDNEPLGLLPLQLNTEKGYSEFFGGDFMEYNKVYVKPEFEYLMPEFFKRIEGKFKLRSMIGGENYPEDIEVDDYTYFLHLDNINSFEDYLIKFHKKKRRNFFRRVIKSFEMDNISIRYNNWSDIEYLIKNNILTFGEDSHFFDKNVISAFRSFLDSKYDVHMISILVDDVVECVSLAIYFNETYYCELTGTNKDSVENLGRYLLVKTVEQAIQLGARIYDSGRGDCNWKERWHLEKLPQYKLSNL